MTRKVMRSYSLVLPDDPDVQALLAGISVFNTGHVAIGLRAPGVLRGIAVEGWGSILSMPVAINGGTLTLELSRAPSVAGLYRDLYGAKATPRRGKK